MEEYEPEMVSLFDEDGTEIEFELLDVIDYEGDSYAVMLPPDDNEVVIMLLEELNDEEDVYSPVEDDETLTAVFEAFKEKYKDEFNFED
ncbi:MAG: DUF1292 domain-containing protein [Clostridia bacterium]|nr:DUF1292 domain-containing protein [Clostridia bacterium]